MESSPTTHGSANAISPASGRVAGPGDRQLAAAHRRWKRWRVLGRADKWAAAMTAPAIVLMAASLLHGPPAPGNPVGFIMVAPLVAIAYLIALIAMFLERERHGLVRALLAIGAAILAFAGLAYAEHASPGTLILAYWVPCALGLASLFVIARAKQAVGAR